MKNKVSIIAFALSIFIVFKAASQEVLTNREIISMKIAKLSDELVIAKINASDCRFELDAQGLIELKLAKVPDKIVKIMFLYAPSTELMTNDDVVKITQAKISTDILKEKIRRTNHNFDVSPSALINLKTAKVNDSIVKEMITNPTQNTTKTQSKRQEERALKPEKAEKTEKVEPAIKNTNAPSPWEKVIITNNDSDVSGMDKTGDININVSFPFEKEDKLKADAIKKLKKEASKNGATHVLIKSSKFVDEALPKYTIVAVGYRK